MLKFATLIHLGWKMVQARGLISLTSHLVKFLFQQLNLIPLRIKKKNRSHTETKIICKYSQFVRNKTITGLLSAFLSISYSSNKSDMFKHVHYCQI